MAKIMYGSSWVEIGEGIKRNVGKDAKEESKDKEKTIMTLYSIPSTPFVMVMPDEDKMGSSAVNPSRSKLFEALPSIKQVVVLNSLYKTKYPDPDALVGLPDGMAPMKTYKTSFVTPDENNWLVKAIGAPAHFMAMTSGFGAACLVECEMTGRPGYQVNYISDGHYVSTESM